MADVAHYAAGLAKMNEGCLLPAERQAVALKALDMMREGSKLTEIAQACNLSQGRITQLVLEHFPDEWRKAKTTANVIRYEQAQEEFEKDSGHDGLKLAYARERARYAHLMLQSTHREMFGQKQEVSVSHQVVMDAGLLGQAADLLARVRGRVIDAQEVGNEAVIVGESSA